MCDNLVTGKVKTTKVLPSAGAVSVEKSHHEKTEKNSVNVRDLF